MGELKADDSNADYVMNTRERVLRARDAIVDMPLDEFRRKQLDDWLQGLTMPRIGKFDLASEARSVSHAFATG
jgi:hypothetical protein